MTRTSRRWAKGGIAAAMAVLSAVVLILGACGKQVPARPAEAARESLTIAVPKTPHAALMHLAKFKGYYAQEGLDVTLVETSHGKAALDLMVQGSADLATAAEVPFVISVLNEGPLGVLATVANVSSEMAAVARRDRQVVQPGDLRGKRVGVTFGTSGEYYLWALMTRHQIPPDALTLVNLPPGDMAKALSEGAVDAVSTWEPVKSAAQHSLGAQAVVFAEPEVYTVTHVVIGRSQTIASRSGAMRKLLAALIKAERFAASQPDQSLAALAAWLQVDVGSLRPGWSALSLQVNLRQSQLLTIEDQARWAMSRGYASRSDMPNFLSHIHLDPLLAVQPERVSVVH